MVSKNFKNRLTISFVGIFLILTFIYLSPFGLYKWLFTAVMAGSIGLALWEFYNITEPNGYRPQKILGVGFSIIYIFSLCAESIHPIARALPEAVLGLALISSFLYYFSKGDSPFVNLAMTFFGLFYLTIPLGCLVSINFMFPSDAVQDGRCWLLYVFSVTKLTDTAAYFTGKLLGKTPLAPYISPKKTIEGALGGLLVGIITSVIFYLTAQSCMSLTFWQSLALGGAISLLAQVGDLSESLLKRDMKVKDSSQLPGLGGFLDIVDSLVFTAPMIYIYLKLT